MTREERVEKLRIDLHNAYWDEELVLIRAFADEIRRECNKERDQYKAWWEGTTETHNQIRKLYDDQNARMWAIIKRPECPEGLAQRMLKMPEADQNYFLSLAVESTAYADEIRMECGNRGASWFESYVTDTAGPKFNKESLRAAIMGKEVKE